MTNALGKIFSRSIRKRIEQAVVDRMSGMVKTLIESLNDFVRRTPNAANKLLGMFKGGMFSATQTVKEAASKMASVVEPAGGEQVQLAH